MTNLLASLIIPTCDRSQNLRRCLVLLVHQLPPDEIEILVCDDGRQEETQLMIQRDFPAVHWHRGPRRGPAANRNGGARLARAKWLIFLDDDVEPAGGFLAAYLAAMRMDEAALLHGPTYQLGPRRSLAWEAPDNPDGEFLISCNFAVRRQVFREVGEFDERFPSAAFEDTELAERFERTGIRPQFLREAAVSHPLRPLPSAFKLAKRWEARVIYGYDLGAPLPQLAWRLPKHVALVILSRFRNIRWSRENCRAAAAFLLEFVLVLIDLPHWLVKYRFGPRSRFWMNQRLSGQVPANFGL